LSMPFWLANIAPAMSILLVPSLRLVFYTSERGHTESWHFHKSLCE
jgi:hypothetical protein